MVCCWWIESLPSSDLVCPPSSLNIRRHRQRGSDLAQQLRAFHIGLPRLMWMSDKGKRKYWKLMNTEVQLTVKCQTRCSTYDHHRTVQITKPSEFHSNKVDTINSFYELNTGSRCLCIKLIFISNLFLKQKWLPNRLRWEWWHRLRRWSELWCVVSQYPRIHIEYFYENYYLLVTTM